MTIEELNKLIKEELDAYLGEEPAMGEDDEDMGDCNLVIETREDKKDDDVFGG